MISSAYLYTRLPAVDSFDTVKLLIKHGADVNARTSFADGTPLHKAVEGGHVDVAKLLIEHGATIDAMDWNEITPVGLAVENGTKSRKWLTDIDASAPALEPL